MMAIIGFAVLFLAGCALIAAAITITYTCSLFTSGIQWTPLILFGGAGAACLVAAIKYAPFTIVAIASAS